MNDWKSLKKPLRGPIAVALGFGIAVGAIAGWFGGRWSLGFKDFKWLDVMTAFGTVGAVIVAVSASWAARKIAQSERDDEAEVIRKMVRPELISLIGAINDTYYVISNFLYRPSGRDRLGNHDRARLKVYEPNFTLPVCHQMLSRLHRLPSSESRAIAALMSTGPIALSNVLVAKDMVISGDDPNYMFGMEMVEEGLDLLSNMARDLIGALSEETVATKYSRDFKLIANKPHHSLPRPLHHSVTDPLGG